MDWRLGVDADREAIHQKWGVKWPFDPDLSLPASRINPGNISIPDCLDAVPVDEDVYFDGESASDRARQIRSDLRTHRQHIKILPTDHPGQPGPNGTWRSVAYQIGRALTCYLGDMAPDNFLGSRIVMDVEGESLVIRKVNLPGDAPSDIRSSEFKVDPSLGRLGNYRRFNEYMETFSWPDDDARFFKPWNPVPLETYEGYLRVWDTRKLNPDVNFAEIARRLDGDDYAKEWRRESLRKQAARQHRKAQELIEGGFLEIP